MEWIFTYMENQNATLYASSLAITPPDIVPIAPVSLFMSLQHCQFYEVKIIWIPDPPTFHAEPQKDQILYKDWHL